VIDSSLANKHVVKLYLGVRRCLKGTSNVRERAVTKVSEIYADKLEELRFKSSFPLVSRSLANSLFPEDLF
jgi:hypothetical protein